MPHSMLKYMIVALIMVFGALLLFSIYKALSEKIKYNKKLRQIIEGPNLSLKTTENVQKSKKPFLGGKLNVFKNFYKEYLFFGRSKRRFFMTLILGYLICFAVLYLISTDVTIALILGMSWFILFYIFYDGKNEKSRKKYIKGFSMALRTITASVEAGNSFPEAISSIARKDTMSPKIKEEFAILGNNLKSNKTLEDALNIFWERNSMFPEFSMFVIVMQFYSQKGGSGLGKILVELEKTLNEKVESYSEIDTELGVHKLLMNALIVIYFVIIFGIKLFMPNFYVELIDNDLGWLKCIGSIVCLTVAVMFFKSMVRNAAEG